MALVGHHQDLKGPIREGEVNPALVRRILCGGLFRGEDHTDHSIVSFPLGCLYYTTFPGNVKSFFRKNKKKLPARAIAQKIL